jgi:peptidoglycan hydrolase CwlO-like protein
MSTESRWQANHEEEISQLRVHIQDLEEYIDRLVSRDPDDIQNQLDHLTGKLNDLYKELNQLTSISYKEALWSHLADFKE